MRIYISGPMTGIPNKNAPAFMSAEAHCEMKGWTVENPVRLDEDLERMHRSIGKSPPTYEDYLRRDIQLLARCDAIVMLPGWSRSRGALLEAKVATEIGLRYFGSLEEVPWVCK